MRGSHKRILVIGAGPAGLASAIFLRQIEGLAVDVVTHRPHHESLAPYHIGESLPPQAARVLKQLGVWDSFQQSVHLPSYGNISYWGSAKAGFTDHIQHPIGHGWHLDRRAFVEMLWKKVSHLGGRIQAECKVVQVERAQDQWQVTLSGSSPKKETYLYDFIFDASGRNSWLARRQGIDRLFEDSQLALVAFLQLEAPLDDTRSLIETMPDGWWYSAPIPGGRMATTFLCKPDTIEKALWQTPKGWFNLFSQTQHTRTRTSIAPSQLLTSPAFVSAESSILEHMHGPGWVAVGDAAMAFDPIASHGILMAMVSARDAVEAYVHASEGLSSQAFIAYEKRMRTTYLHYARQRQAFYRAEKRFGQLGYWKG